MPLVSLGVILIISSGISKGAFLLKISSYVHFTLRIPASTISRVKLSVGATPPRLSA